MRQVLGDDKYEELLKRMTQKMLDGQNNMVKCKCGNMIEFV